MAVLWQKNKKWMVRKYHPKPNKCKSNNIKKLSSNSKFKWLIQTTLMHNKWCKWIQTYSLTCSKWQMSKFNKCKWCNSSRCNNSRYSLIAWETKLILVICLPNNNKPTNSISTNNSSNSSSMPSKWWLRVIMIRINLLIKTACPLVQSSTSRFCSNNSNMDRNKLITVKKLCRTLISSICKNRGKKRILFKKRFKKSSKFVQITMHFLVILNSPLVILLFITIHKVHLSMLKTCLS